MINESSDDTSSDDPTPTDDTQGGSVNLNDMTKAELVEYAETLGITLDMSMTKAEMIAAIEEAGQ